MALQEAMQLAETHAGEPCTPLAAGSARGFLRQPSTFFGSGTVEEVKSQCSLREFQRCEMPHSSCQQQLKGKTQPAC